MAHPLKEIEQELMKLSHKERARLVLIPAEEVLQKLRKKFTK
jgi:hypothetical protein